MLRGGEHGGDHHRTCMHRSALERVVVVLPVRRGAVDEGRVVGIETARVSSAVQRPSPVALARAART